MDPRNQRVIGRAQARKVRENVSDHDIAAIVGGNAWSEWVLAMTPNERHHEEFRNERAGPEAEGYRLKSKAALREKFAAKALRIDQPCGIYEWKVRPVSGLVREPAKECVVYIGCTCRERARADKEDASIFDRIWEYCLNGSHKSNHINKALSKGYELWVRVKESGDHDAVIGTRREAAEEDENRILLCYDYAWNKRGVERWLA